jgi:NAD(P)-dependent dehydrogenase (short-subunit alcohol dehydrogenase family)
VSEVVDEMRKTQRAHVDAAIERFGPSLAGRVAVVTGSARGIGRSVVDGLLRAGASVVSSDRRWDGSEEYRKTLDAGERSISLEADITDDAALDRLYAETMDRFGRVDILVNNAGLVSETLFAPLGHVKLLDTKDSDWEAMFRVNVFGTIKVIRRFVVPMLAAGGGSIMNIVSSGVLMTSNGGAYFGARPWTTEMPYQATKSALTTATFYLAQELFNEGIAVNAIMPGHTRASWFDATARAFTEGGGGVYFMRPLVCEHMLPLALFLATQSGAQPPVTGRLYHTPDWNYDHGYGDYRVWHDYDIPEKVEEGYKRLEGALPKYWRAGLGRAPFDVERVAFAAAVDKLELLATREGASGAHES